MKPTIIYTDGACLGNPGPGGYGVVILQGGQRKELTGGYRLTTNNRMELMAAIKALETLKSPSKVTLYTDSKYLYDAMTRDWAKRWRANRWWRNKREKATNIDLWKRLLDLCDTHTVTYKWTKGHAGDRDNEIADQLAVQATRGENLPNDPGYQNDNGPRQLSF
jgi:ribonuclease HI